MRTIIYLDQSYLSNLAKAQYHYIADKNESDFWLSLLEYLKRAVLSNKAVCPELEIQGIESSYDTRIEEPVGKIINELSQGLQFNLWQDILDCQIEDAARQFLGIRPDGAVSWSKAFRSDPDASIETRIQTNSAVCNGIEAASSLPSKYVQGNRQGKLDFVGMAKDMLITYNSAHLSWPELLIQSKKGVLDGHMGKRAQQSIECKLRGGSLEDQLDALYRRFRLENLWDRLHKIGINTEDNAIVMAFANSPVLLNIPFVDVNGSIWAAIAECHRQGRLPQGGDFYDVPILSVVLPYCDVVTTDKFMKDILCNKFHFDDKYKVRLFSSAKPDREYFCEFLRQLLHDYGQ
jgi:hypothetical protein